MNELEYNFTPKEPALCLAQGQGGEGVYRQRGLVWYWDGRSMACQIVLLARWSQAEKLAHGRQALRDRHNARLSW